MRLFEVGDRIYGFCNGFFGRDCYKNKICVMSNDGFAVFVDLDNGYARVLNYIDLYDSFCDDEKIQEAINSWKVQE